MTRLLLPALLVAVCAVRSDATDPPPSKKTEDAARAIARQLRSHMPFSPAPGWNDFQLRIVDTIGKDEFATNAGWEDWGDEKPTPYVTLTRGFLAAHAQEPDALALLIGRELARLHLGLAPPKGEPRSDATDADADLFAVKLVLQSGYSVSRGLRALQKHPDKARPAWVDRIAKLLEKPDESLLRSMAAFQNGLLFLAIEDHTTAIVCFEAVTREFPQSHEAWANLGFARLRCHSDQFPAADMPGHVLGLSHSIRTAVVLRCVDWKRWYDAMGAFKEAERLKPGQPLVLANMGLGYLLAPSGPEIADAEKYLLAARKAHQGQPTALAGEVELLVNLAVARLASKKPIEALKLLDEAAALAAKLPAGPPAQFTRAITFNRALAFSDGNPSYAARLFLRFLETTPRYDPWWSDGYERYLKLCEKLQWNPRSRDELRKPEPQQAQVAILASGKIVKPGDDPDELLSRLGKPSQKTPVTPRVSLLRARFASHGIEVVITDEVLLVVLISKKAGVPWPRTHPCGRPAGDLRVGMSREQVEALPGGADFALQPFSPQADVCAYYPELELAVIYDRPGPDGIVKMVIVGNGVR
ncbi:MAG: hypothetical protein U0792_16255 [Gemmataceae bacterium]